MIRILIVEDDRNLCKMMKVYLEQNNYEALTAYDGIEALEVLDNNYVDLIICDIMMPRMDGIELTKSLRDSHYTLPILLVTAKGTMADKRLGFQAGTDDYMVKPIDLDEMLLRVEAILRRSNIINVNTIEIGKVRLIADQLTIVYSGQTLELPLKEFNLLFKLLSYPKQIFTRMQLMEDIWGMEAQSDERTVDVHIKRLREKLSHIKEFEIVTVRGLGYKAEVTV